MLQRFRSGLVVGKFAPLHLGHEHLVTTAHAACDQLTLLSYARPDRPGCGPERRAGWLAVRFPFARSVVVTDSWLAGAASAHGMASLGPVPHDDAPADVHRRFCAAIVRDLLATTVDAVFTSEDYGPGFARVLGAELGRPVAHVAVDSLRSQVPISATRIHSDVHRHREWLAPEVYASFVETVAILGGESTGKTSLARALADHFQTEWVPEYGRELWELRGGRLEPDDLPAIAREQIAREERARLSARRYLFCDSTPLTTRFYFDALFPELGPELGPADPRAQALDALATRGYDRTVLCAPDFPFVQDGTRQDEAFRQRQQSFYTRELSAARLPYLMASGSLAERVAQLVEALEAGQSQ